MSLQFSTTVLTYLFLFAGLEVILVGLSATRRGSSDTKLGFTLNLPDMKYYTSSPTTTPVTSRQAFGNTVKKFLFIIVLVGLLGFEYRNRFGHKVAPVQTSK